MVVSCKQVVPNCSPMGPLRVWMPDATILKSEREGCRYHPHKSAGCLSVGGPKWALSTPKLFIFAVDFACLPHPVDKQMIKQQKHLYLLFQVLWSELSVLFFHFFWGGDGLRVYSWASTRAAARAQDRLQELEERLKEVRTALNVLRSGKNSSSFLVERG